MALPTNRVNPKVHWKIWYHDPDSPRYCTTWTNRDGPARDAPTTGVICITQPVFGGRYREIICNADYYAIDEEGKWTGMDQSGIDDRTANNIPFHALKQGRWINTERFQEILSRARGDVHFGGNGKFRAVER
jgi:hypothetical protein